MAAVLRRKYAPKERKWSQDHTPTCIRLVHWSHGCNTNTAFREMVSLEAGSGHNCGFQDEPWLRFGEESRPKREELES